MTEPDLSPEQDVVRRLLAEARHDGPVPEEVRARLDATLAELKAERHDLQAAATVVDLPARRRRRRGTVLLAAAAVVVAGVGVGQALDRSGDFGLGGGGDSTSSSEDRTYAESSEGQDDAGAPSPFGSSQLKARSQKPATADAGAPQVRSTHLRTDLRRLRAQPTPTESRPAPSSALGCGLLVPGRGDQVEVTLDGKSAVAVFRPVSGSHQRVDLYACGTSDVIRSIRLAAP